MSTALHLLVTLAVCLLAVGPLAGARWVWRSPRTGILLWQLLALTVVLCVGGVAYLIAPWVGGAVAATLLAVFGHHWLATLRTRRQHRRILSLVARADDAVPGVLVLDHPLTVAYCLPGLRSHVVLSSGALAALSRDELAAVLAHEQTHARERHDLVLAPFLALRPLCRSVADAVALLVEMRADESACPRSLSMALRRFTSVTPPGTLGMADAAVLARLSRLSAAAAPLPWWLRWSAVVAGLTLVSTPLSFLVW